MADADENLPILRLEHSTSEIAGCQHAACKKKAAKIAKGELRIGKYQYYEPGDKWITMWRHWRCAPTPQIKLLKQLADEVPENVAGFEDISPESQEQVRLAFENDKIADNDFTDIRPDLIKSSRGGRSNNVTGYRVDTAPSGRAGCRNPACKDAGVKIGKGELRLGLVTDFQGHESLVWKHWKCATLEEIAACKELLEQDSFDGLNLLPEEYKSIVLESIESGQALEPPVLEDLVKAVKPRKSRAKKAKKEDGTDDDELAGTPSLDLTGDAHPTQAESKENPKAKAKRGRKRKGEEDADESVNEVVAPQKKQGHIVKEATEEADPTEARIAALANIMRTKTAQSSEKRS